MICTSRRDFLKAAGVSGAMLPLLEGGRARAATAPKRLAIFCWSNGIRRNDFWPELGPTKSETDWKLPVPGTAPPQQTPVAVPMLEPLVKEFRDDMMVVGGFDISAFYEAQRANYQKTPRRGDAHETMPALLTGAYPAQFRDFFQSAGGPSIDQYIGRELAKRHGLAFPSLVIGGRANAGYQGTISYAGYDDPGITPENNPNTIFKNLFAGRNLPAGTIDRLALARKSVLDYLGPELNRFQQQVGTSNKQKIDAHLQTIRDLETQLKAQANAVACEAPKAPSGDFGPNDMLPSLLKLNCELLATAFRCDLTRVATFNFENTGGNNIAFSWLGQEFTGKGDEYPTRQHHDIAHNFFRSDLGALRHSRVNQWFFEQVAYFARLLKNTPEGNGTMLDNTAIVVLNSMGQNHAAMGIPCVILGSCGGYFKTKGRLVRLNEYAKPSNHAFFWGPGELGMRDGKLMEYNAYAVAGAPINRLLVSLANAMDVPTATFGESRYGGELTELRG